MTIYVVKHTAKVDYLVCVEATSREDALGPDSYAEAALGHASDHYWFDSEIVEEYGLDDPDAPQPDIALG